MWLNSIITIYLYKVAACLCERYRLPNHWAESFKNSHADPERDGEGYGGNIF